MNKNNNSVSISFKEQKELVLKDLCARLPYGVKIELTWWVMDEGTCMSTTLEPDHIEQIRNDELGDVEIKSYLRPMSSMTEEQCYDFYCRFVENEIDYNDFKKYYFDGCLWHKVLTTINDCGDIIDWFNKNHFDYRGLIDKGLAIDATGLNIY